MRGDERRRWCGEGDGEGERRRWVTGGREGARGTYENVGELKGSGERKRKLKGKRREEGRQALSSGASTSSIPTDSCSLYVCPSTRHHGKFPLPTQCYLHLILARRPAQPPFSLGPRLPPYFLIFFLMFFSSSLLLIRPAAFIHHRAMQNTLELGHPPTPVLPSRHRRFHPPAALSHLPPFSLAFSCRPVM
jgi:hypothetical protein